MRIARATDWLGALRDRVARKDTEGAMRLATVAGLRRLTPQNLFEEDAAYVARLVRVHAPRRRQSDRVTPGRQTVAA